MKNYPLAFSVTSLSFGIFLCLSLAGCQAGSKISSSTSSSSSSSSGSNAFASATVGATQGKQIPSTFMGFSHEWDTAQSMMGDSSTTVDTTYRQLLENLMEYGSGPIHIRIGGNSTDTSGEPTSSTVQPFAELANALGVHFTLGVNLGANNVQLAVDQVNAYGQQMPSKYLDAIEVGNEPDNYASSGYRTSTYGYSDYLADFDTWKNKITPVLPSGVLLMGASWASTSSLTHIANYASNESSSLSTLSQHYYIGDAQKVTDDSILLSSASATGGPQAVASAVTIAHNAGLPFRMGELNSLYNGGLAGVSNAFGSALWALDTMFEYWSVGADGVNWQVGSYSGNAYNPFAITTSTSSGKTTYAVTVNPLYYGLLLFQKATANRAYLLPVSLSTSANMKVWATVDTSGVARILVLNKDLNLSGDVSIKIGSFTKATVTRLTAPSYTSTSGVTLGGQTFDNSSDGTLQGTAATESYTASSGSFSIPITTASAMLVELSN